ncbi:hypothetical protein GCM10027047_13860 [Rhodococcus aerolatus]
MTPEQGLLFETVLSAAEAVTHGDLDEMNRVIEECANTQELTALTYGMVGLLVIGLAEASGVPPENAFAEFRSRGLALFDD